MLDNQQEITSTRSEETVTPSAPSPLSVPDKTGAGFIAMNGWIKFHRQFMQWEWYTDNNVKAIFIHCLLSANMTTKDWRGVSINRGSFISSIGKLAIETGLSIKAVRIALDKLKKTGEIIVKGASQWTMVTVCKYEVYQSYNDYEGQTKGTQKDKRGANEGQTRGKRRATTKEYKEGEEYKEEYTPDSEPFKAYKVWATENAPDVLKMKEPLTDRQFTQLLIWYDKDVLKKIMQSMHNWPDLLKKRKSANLTIQDWASRDGIEKRKELTEHQKYLKQQKEVHG